MDKKAEILQELKETAPFLASLRKTGCMFNVSGNYFGDGLAGTILLKIKEPQNNPTGEISEIAPVLSSIGKQNVYAAPLNYFKNFQVNIPPVEKVANIKKANTIVKYVVAATFAGIIFVAAFLFKHHNARQNFVAEDISSIIKGISDDELNEYADEHSIQFNDDSLVDEGSKLDVIAELKVVSNEELKQYYQNEHLKLTPLLNN